VAARAASRGVSMSVREILKMGDPRLLRQAEPVQKFGTRELDELIADMQMVLVLLHLRSV